MQMNVDTTRTMNTVFFNKELPPKFIRIFAYLLICTFLNSCGIYSFSGASVDPNAKTVSVLYFDNNAQLVIANLSQTFTDALKDKMLNATSLNLTKTNGDIQFSGQITDYVIKPVAVQGNETASMNSLSITVKVSFVNKLNEKQNWEESFTSFVNFPTTQNVSDVQNDLIKQINDNLVYTIFNRAFSNW